ncbi:MAG: polysaccharide deacetylase family protein [Bacteroidia bacterium]|nr:polysaccharide deacetylase family protein [Bacteroidia bacterium]
MKPLLKYLLRRASGLVPLSSLIALTGRRCLLPVYHLASDHSAPHIWPIYPVRNIPLFRQDLDTLLRHYTPITTADLLGLVSTRRFPGKPVFHLSFDDGLRQIWDEVAPVLLEKGVPATFFVNTDFVGNKALFYRYLAALLVSRLRQTPPSGTLQATCHQKLQAAGITHPDLGTALMQVDYARRQVLPEVAALLEVDPAVFLQEYRPYLDTDQLIRLQAQGFTIGAHSQDHPEYRFIPPEAQLSQTKGSLDALDQMIQPPLRTFAFPFTDHGVRAAFFQAIAPQVDLTFGCAGIKDDISPLHLQRLPMEGTMDSARSVIGAEYLYYILRQPLGKNQITR